MSSLTVKLICYFVTEYAEYSDSIADMKKAEETSNLDSSPEDVNDCTKRSRKRPRKFAELVDSSDGEEFIVLLIVNRSRLPAFE